MRGTEETFAPARTIASANARYASHRCRPCGMGPRRGSPPWWPCGMRLFRA